MPRFKFVATSYTLRLPLAVPANREHFKVIVYKTGLVSVRVHAELVDMGTNAPTGEREWYSLSDYDKNFTVVEVEGGFTVEYYGNPYLYNLPDNKGGRSCSCPVVRVKGVHKTAKDAVFAGLCARAEDERVVRERVALVPGALPSTPVRSLYGDPLRMDA